VTKQIGNVILEGWYMFVPGELYRRRDLHERFGGQRQGGISTPSAQHFIMLFAGEQGEHYGYQHGFPSRLCPKTLTFAAKEKFVPHATSNISSS